MNLHRSEFEAQVDKLVQRLRLKYFVMGWTSGFVGCYLMEALR